MYGGTTYDWLILAVAAVLCPVMVYVAWRALFADRLKHVRRCPKCRYDMTGSLGLRCSECGHIASEESRLFFRHRRPFVALGAIVACAGMALLVNEGLNARTWMSLVPTRVLIATLPFTIDETGNLPDELTRRIRANSLEEGHWHSLLSRAADGDWKRAQLSDAWVASYGQLILGCRRNAPRESELGEVIGEIPPRVDITTRDVWPIGVPLLFDVNVQNWWAAGYEVRLRARPRVEGATGTTYYHYSHAPPATPFSLDVPILDDATTEVMVDVQVARRVLAQDGMPGPWEDVLEDSLTVPVKIEGTVAEHFEADRREIVEQAMRRVFRFGVVKWSGGGESPVRVRIELPSSFITELDDLAVGVRVELLYRQQVARRLDLWWLAGAKLQSASSRNYNFDIVYEDTALLMQAQDDENWSMRITGDAALALRAGDAKSYWAGSFTQPLIVNHPETRSPPPGAVAPDRGWRTEDGPWRDDTEAMDDAAAGSPGEM